VGESLRGQLLIATPALPDEFERTVVLVIEHNDEGAMGLILNRPTETVVAEAVPGLDGLSGSDRHVYAGGPVARDTVIALADFEDVTQAARTVVGQVGLVDPDTTDLELRDLRVYAGHAGWGPGQLDSELEAEAWIVDRARPEDPFADQDLWPLALQRMGGEYALLARMPDDPSLN
jgi:putative transcriptional regulator